MWVVQLFKRPKSKKSCTHSNQLEVNHHKYIYIYKSTLKITDLTAYPPKSGNLSLPSHMRTALRHVIRSSAASKAAVTSWKTWICWSWGVNCFYHKNYHTYLNKSSLFGGIIELIIITFQSSRRGEKSTFFCLAPSVLTILNSRFLHSKSTIETIKPG